MKAHTRVSPYSSAILLVLLAIAWIAFAPVPFGGQVSYVIVVGNSMEPGMHGGDLAIVRESPDYQVGDIAAYRDPRMGPVIHRIVDHARNRFVLKGDNNQWLDSYEPTSSEVIGKLWVHIPGAGRPLELARGAITSPLPAAVTGAVILAVLAGAGRAKARRSSSRFPPPAPGGQGKFFKGNSRARPGSRGGSVTQIDEGAQTLFTIVAVAALAFLALGLMAFSQPTERTLSFEAPFEHVGEFSYSAAVRPGAVYDSNRVATGDPVFRRITDGVDFTFEYQLVTDENYEVSTTSRLTAQIADVSGWRRTIELQPETVFASGHAVARGRLDFRQVDALLDAVQRETDLRRDQYTVTIAPDIVITGIVADREIREQFAPRLLFRLDPLQFSPIAPSGGGRDATDYLRPTQPGSVKVVRTEPNALPLLALRLDVAIARRMAALGLMVALGGAALLWLSTRVGPKENPRRIAARYGPLLLAVREGAIANRKGIIDLASIDDLAKLADRSGRMILHYERADGHQYYVQEADATYRFTPSAPELKVSIELRPEPSR